MISQNWKNLSSEIYHLDIFWILLYCYNCLALTALQLYQLSLQTGCDWLYIYIVYSLASDNNKRIEIYFLKTLSGNKQTTTMLHSPNTSMTLLV